MSIFESIKHAIFGDHGPLGAFNHDAPRAAAPGQADTAPRAPASAPPAAPKPQGAAVATAASPTPGAPQPSAPPAAARPVDVNAILAGKAQAAGAQLDWRHSIVDLMKLLGLDSSLAARGQLAGELGYTGAKDGSAAMNIWLHKAVMDKLAADGGKLPAELAHA